MVLGILQRWVVALPSTFTPELIATAVDVYEHKSLPARYKPQLVASFKTCLERLVRQLRPQDRAAACSKLQELLFPAQLFCGTIVAPCALQVASEEMRGGLENQWTFDWFAHRSEVE